MLVVKLVNFLFAYATYRPLSVVFSIPLIPFPPLVSEYQQLPDPPPPFVSNCQPFKKYQIFVDGHLAMFAIQYIIY